ncbi:MAG: exosortase-dependent surface protein XDP1 [Halioglobus sp.]
MLNGHRWVGFAAATAVALFSVPTLANVQTWTFNSATQSFNNTNFGNTLSLTSSDGVHLTVTGWSDTNDISGDDTIETAKLIWAQTAALGVQNRDETTTSPNHSIDSVSSDPDGEFDMLLLEFDTAVSLSGIDLAWALGGNAVDTVDVSILAWDGAGSATLLGSTWANVLDTNGGGYDSVGNYSNVGLSYYTVNPANIESTKWLIGVYNPVFGVGGDAGDDGMKLASITTSTPNPDEPPGEVPVPGTVALVLAGLLALRARRLPKVTAV